MFTGIIDHRGTVTEVEKLPRGLRLEIACEFGDIVEGESIAVDGACLTAIRPREKKFWAELSTETLALTTAGEYGPGARVNLERALRVGDRLGGHFVMGHVDGRGRLALREPHGDFQRYVFDAVPAEMTRYLVKKGSIAVNGVSLTVNAYTETAFEVMLIPHTLERTNLGCLKVGDAINLEYDWLTKVILEKKPWNLS